MKYETIFFHEFGHLMGMQHHYPGDDISVQIDMPPGEMKCVMARNSSEYCSACRTALNIPLDLKYEDAVNAAITEILGRYPD